MRFFNSIFNFLRFNRRNWKAVILCLFAATVFWFFNALNKSYSANINFPISFEYEESYIPVKPLPDKITLNVNGLGWQLLRKSMGMNILPLIITLDNPGEIKKILGTALPPIFSPQLEGLQINFVLTDTIHLYMDKRSTRNVFLAIDSIEHYVRNEFSISSEIRISPNEITLEGPQSLLKALPDTLSLVLPSRKIDKTFSEEVEVKLESDLINRNPPLVNVNFSVDRIKEITGSATLRIINSPISFRPVNRVKEVRYTYTLPESLVQDSVSNTIRAELNLQGFTNGRYKLVPTLKGLPPFSRLIKVDTVDINL